MFRRVIFLETVAGIPGFVAAMVRHFKSLRTFQRDGKVRVCIVSSYEFMCSMKFGDLATPFVLGLPLLIIFASRMH